MDFCTEVAAAADVTDNDTTKFSHDYANSTCCGREFCPKAQQLFGFRTTTMNFDDSDDSHDQLHDAACRCTHVIPHMDESEDDGNQLTPLQLSVRRSDYEMMKRLLAAGADPEGLEATHGNTALHLAAQLGDATAFKILLHHSANIDARTYRGFDSLTFAVQSGSVRIVKLLVDRGYCVHQLIDDIYTQRQFTLLHLAVESDRVEVVEFLLQLKVNVNERDSYGNTCLHLASRLGHCDIVRLLLRHGARVHDKSFHYLTALYFAAENGHRDVFELLLHHGANLNERGLGGATLLHYAIKNGDVKLNDALPHRGAHVGATNRFGKTPLHFAIAEKNWRALELLLGHGADVNSKDALGKTSLHTAIECCRKEIYAMLLGRGADVNAKDNLQQTPLHFAVKQGCHATVELLLCHSADANARDDARQTPLHLAVRFGHVRLLEPMLRHNVDFNALDANGQSPLHLAVLNEAKLIYCGYPYTFFAQLLKNGARVRTRTFNTGETPLHAAVKKRCPIFAKHLLAHGSDVDAIESVERKTSLYIAVENDDVDCVEQLLTYGADITNFSFRGNISLHVLKSFVDHFARKLAAGMNVAPKYSKIVRKEFAKQCADEVDALKLTKICDERTYYEFLRGNRRCLANFVFNDEVCKVFEDHARANFSSDESMLRRNYPVFADMLDKNYRVGVRYAPVLDAAFDRLINLFQLPAVPTERILDFLDDNDMKNILNAIPSPVNYS